MKPAIFLLILFGSLNPEKQFSNSDFSRLHSLAGSWVVKGKNSIILETWKMGNDSSMTGASYIIKGQDTALQETVTLIIRNGVITYTPVTKNQNNEDPVVFTLDKIKGNKFTFTNPAHDFPQEIHYDLVNETHLLASISGMVKGVNKSIEYPFEKQK